MKTLYMNSGQYAYRNRRAREESKALAAEMGIELHIDRSPCFSVWISEDKMAGSRFCLTWGEVRRKLKALKKGYYDPKPELRQMRDERGRFIRCRGL